MKIIKGRTLALFTAIAALTQSVSALPMTPVSADDAGISTMYAASDTQVISGAVYEIQSIMSQKLLTVAEDGNVHQWESLSDASQRWMIYALSDGSCKIISAADPTKALTVENGDGTDGNNVYAAESDGSLSQQFKIEKDGDDYYITTCCSDGKACVDVYNVSAENGANICQWSYWGGTGQKFRITPVDGRYELPLGDLNFDGSRNIFDLSLMKKGVKNGFDVHTAGIADLDGSGSADAADVKLLQEYLAGKTTEFPAGTHYVYELPDVYDGEKTLTGSRMMEKLDRGVVAVSTGKAAFISWRFLASDESDIGFNVYRTTDGVTKRVNDTTLYGGTNYTDTSADLTKNNTYFVKTVYNGKEWDTEGDYTLAANSPALAITIPIKEGGNIHFVWVGDFNGDGKYDYLLDRTWDEQQKLEAYLNDGTYLWTINMGYNSENKDNIEPGASTIDVGMWDGATVYDIDCDGSAEVLLRIADGVTFGDGNVYSNKTHANAQAIAVINGMTGGLEATAPVPDDKIDEGPKACMMEIGYLDGVKPSLICWVKNRNSDKSFNSYNVAYGYDANGNFVQQWKAGCYGAEAHNIRVADVDYDGKDEVLHMGYALNGDGSLRYIVPNVVHGDRWYVGSFCNGNNGKEMYGYGIQQDNASGLLEYFYNASTGKLIWEHYAAEGTADVGRGNVGDLDPNYDGFECWSFQGLYSMDNQKLADSTLYPVLRLWWDGDLLSESFNDGRIEEWNYENKSTSRIMTTWNVAEAKRSDRGVPMFYGDIMGDWREEIVMTNYAFSALTILTTTQPTDERIYCLAQNPAYRNCMTGKGYYQSHMLDYFLGANMEAPEAPDICYIGECNLDENAVYAIRNVNSNRCMDVYKSGTENGTNVQQYSTVPGKPNTAWTIKDAGGGYYYIISQLGDGKTHYLDVDGGSPDNGANVQIWARNGEDAQKFKLKRNADGSYMILTKCSGDTKYVEVVDAETSAGANVRQWQYTNHSCQKWYFQKLS